MFRGLVLAAAIVGLITVGLVGGQQAAEAQQTASATRSLPSEVEGGGTLTVTISVADYGGIGQLTETFPGDFTFEGSSPEVEPSGQTLTFNLVGDTSVSYTLTAPTTTETISISGFSGTLGPAEGDVVTVRGPSSVTVSAPAQQTASATRSLPSEVEGGGTLTVTISVADYGGIGQLTETFPGDFTFVSSSPEVEPSGQTLTFNLVGDTSVSYTLTAPTTTETISISGFSGTLGPAEGDVVTVRGPSSVTVSAPAQQTASATRSLPSEVEGGGTLTVTISVADYGGIGQLTETFPGDFTFEGSSPDVEPSGQTLTFNLVGDTSVSYTLTAPTTTETISISGFSGTLGPAEGDVVTVRGPSSVTVRVVAPEPEPQVNRAPVFSAGNSTTRSIDENLASGANVGAVVRATDADGDTLTYSLTGTDAGSFTINSGTGQIMVGAGSTLDYETKASYMVTVTATDPAGDSDSIDVTIIVTDVVELGMVSGDPTAEYAENGMGAVATYAADGPVTAGWSVSGADMDDFAISNEGVLSFASAPDFEMPMGGADNDSNTYMVTVKAEVGGEMEMVEVTVMVTNVDEIGTLSGPETVSNYMENSEDPVGTYMVSGGSMSEMANLTLEGDDAGDFSVSSAGVLSFRSSPDFENPTDADMDNTYMVTVKAEAGGEMAMQPVTVTVTNVDEDGTVMLSSMAPVVGVELTATLANSDMVTEDTVTWQWSKSMTMDGTFEDIDGATMMTYTPVAADENYYLMAKAMYTDGHGSDKMAMATSANAVSTGDPLLATYDTNPRNGMIDRPEVISAINDYLDNGVPSRADVIRLINLYLDS